ncbi:MAG TPA: hypothetical protein VN758_09425 [Solirubrobacterales bacterium]|nr:hypothetical protein [Solirubrobacterales bacterium]
MKQRLSRFSSVRGTIAIAVGLTACMALAPALASGATDLGPANTVYIKQGGGGPEGGLRFVAPKTIASGAELEVLNQTNPHQVGPHTFSLVTKGSLPKTKKAEKNCFTPKHICMAIAKWHGTNGNGPVTKNPTKAGLDGWDTLGSVTKVGDSWFTGEKKPGTSIEQPVSAVAGTTLYFMCAIHPFMQGSIEVVAPVPAPVATS